MQRLPPVNIVAPVYNGMNMGNDVTSKPDLRRDAFHAAECI